MFGSQFHHLLCSGACASVWQRIYYVDGPLWAKEHVVRAILEGVVILFAHTICRVGLCACLGPGHGRVCCAQLSDPRFHPFRRSHAGRCLHTPCAHSSNAPRLRACQACASDPYIQLPLHQQPTLSRYHNQPCSCVALLYGAIPGAGSCGAVRLRDEVAWGCCNVKIPYRFWF